MCSMPLESCWRTCFLGSEEAERPPSSPGAAIVSKSAIYNESSGLIAKVVVLLSLGNLFCDPCGEHRHWPAMRELGSLPPTGRATHVPLGIELDWRFQPALSSIRIAHRSNVKVHNSSMGSWCKCIMSVCRCYHARLIISFSSAANFESLSDDIIVRHSLSRSSFASHGANRVASS